MGRVALRAIRAHVVRFVLSVLAVMLGVAFVAGTFALRTMLSSTFDQIIATSLLGDAYVRGDAAAPEDPVPGQQVGEARTPVPITLADAVAQVDGVAHVLPDLSGPAVLVGADGTAVASGGAPSFAVGLDPDDPTVDVGRGERPSAPGEIAVERTTLASSGLDVGDRTTLVAGGTPQPVTVVGEVDLDAPTGGATIVFLDVATATTAFAPDGLVDTLTVYAEPGATEDELVAAIAPTLDGTAAEVVTGDSLRADARADIEEALGFVETFLLIFAGISLFVGAFLIANTFTMSVRERLRELALLRALGASPTQVFASVLVQAAVVGVVGSLAGVVAGLGLVRLLRTVLASQGMILSGAIPLRPATVTVALVTGTLMSVLAAIPPARQAALTPPVQAMRDEVVVQDRPLRVRTGVGVVLLVAGAAAVVAAVRRPGSDSGPLLGAGAAAVLAGVLLVAPASVRVALGALAAGFVATVRPLGRLARGNVTRHPRRTANTAGALMIGMALVGASAVLAASAQASTRDIVAQEVIADLTLQAPAGPLPDGVAEAVAPLPEVSAVDPAVLGSVLVDGETTAVLGIPPAAFGRSLEVDAVAGSVASLGDREVLAQQDAADDAGWSVGDTLALSSEGGTADVRLGGIIDSQSIQASLVLPEDLADRLVPVTRAQTTAVFVEGAPGVSADDLRTAVTAAVRPFVVVSVLDQEQLASELSEQVGRVLVILYALLGLSVVIAVLGIVNTLALSVIERTREIGLMRAVGLGRLQLAGIITIESVLTAVYGTLVGVAIGVALASTLPTVFADEGLTTLAVPWSQVVAVLALSAVVGVLAAVWPGIRAARLPVLDAVRSE